MNRISLILAISISLITSCQKNYGSRGVACLSADKTTIATLEQITITSCGDEIPTSMVQTQLDWGDGTITDGQTGTHAYATSGTYNIRLLLNGDYAADVTEVDENKVKIQIIVN